MDLSINLQVDGNHIKWQNWNIRHSFNYREGLVLHDVSYEEGEKLRPILHRASLVEMCVPYADPNPPFHRKCAFDVGGPHPHPPNRLLQTQMFCDINPDDADAILRKDSILIRLMP